MAVAMEPTAWRGGDGTHPGKTKSESPGTTTAWGADAQKLMQMMLGQLHTSSSRDTADSASPHAQLSTLDLFGRADPSFSPVASPSASPEFLELEPEEPLPSGWEKCLDLKSGKLYYVEKSSGVSTINDPRKQQQLSAHEFLGSKSSEETLSLKASSSSSSETPGAGAGASLRLLPSTRDWSNLQEQLDHVALATSGVEQSLGGLEDEISNVELDLNLAAGSSPSPSSRRQTVCTMEMIKNALRRSESKPPSMDRGVHKREFQQKLSTVSSSFSSLTSTRSDPVDSCVAPSPSTSSSSSTSSRSVPTVEQSSMKSSSTSTGVCDDEGDVELVMGACTRCLMYVMLKKQDPKCPRCESAVPVDFSEPPCKRQRVGLERR